MLRRKVMQTNKAWHSTFLLFFTLIMSFALIITCEWLWIWAQKPTSLPIKQIHIDGQFTHVSPTLIGQLVKEKISGGFFSLHLSPAKEAILAFPWIAHVSFRRVWPDILIVHCIEQHPVARFGNNGVLSDKGVVFYPSVDSIPQQLPEFDGTVNQASALLSFYHVVNTLSKLLNLSVIDLQVTNTNSWRLTLSNQVNVVIGAHDILNRYQQFVAIYSKLVASSAKKIALVDLRYANGVAVQFQTSPSIPQNHVRI